MLLARAHFELGLFQNAATLYEALLNDPQLEDAWPWEGDAPGPWNIAECAALCWSRADELDNAERVIRTNLSEATDRKKALLLLARIQSEGGRFERVCETLREIESQSPDEPRDWLERAVLALGEVALSRSELLRSIDTKLHATPEVESTFRGLLESYWPAFGLLSGAAQERWLKGTYYRFLPWPSLVCSSLRADSGIQFATAVELELRARVFDGFRDKVWKVQPKTARTNEEDSFLWDFLERARPLTLGQMAHILRSAERAKGESIEKRLAGWLRSTRPQLLAQLWVLELIVPLRNDAVHGTGGPDSESDRVAKHCRSLLDVIVAAG
jgi:tetratricopeptide (TPR) repeat protein